MSASNNLLLRYHIQQIEEARAAIASQNCVCERAKLLDQIDRNHKAVNRLDREAQSADRRKAGA